MSQRLAKPEEAKVLKEQVDAAQRKEAVLKVHLNPWLDEAYLIITSIEGRLASLQETQQKLQADSVEPATEQLVEELKQPATQCTAEVAVVQLQLEGLHAKISAPTK